MDKIDLSHFPLFRNVPESTLSNIQKKLKVRLYPKKTVILKKGEPSRHLLFLVSGQADIIDFDSEGGEVWIATLEPGDHFGELALILNEPRSADVIATSPSSVAFLSKNEALSLLTEHPIIARNMMEHLALTIKQQNLHLHMLNQPSATERIKALLLLKARRYAGDLLVVENLPSQAQLAKMANTSRETVSRTLAKLCREGVLEKDYKRLIIRKPDALMESNE
ncbi:MAG TPA: Crp/Fnr family transcriptional regulator [Piscirickettsiaceae bacterium]|nr:Crp/Fnr family transcriptional regulator [Piscirickettsiaceae bacterium]HIQ39608.1 Crp/Fnr family transcriptional regulator [Sulfurivirga caldicuralii]